MPGNPASQRSLQLNVADLKVGMTVCDLDRPWLETPFALQGFTIFSAADIAEIARYCQYVWVDADDHGRPRIADIPAQPLAFPGSTPATGPGLGEVFNAHNRARQLTRSFLDDVRLGRAIAMKEVKATVSELVANVLRDPEATAWVARIRDHDQYTSEHSLNVGLLAILFGRHLGASEEDMHRLGVAGILHDVGKMRTPLEILNKEGMLERDELRIMQQHATHGRDILIAHRSVAPGAVDVAFTHHEVLDGSGYPRGLKAGAIPELTRMITLCDIYDAMTTDRVYKRGIASLTAMQMLYKLRGSKLDPRLTEAFIRCIGIYPPGTLVELASGEVGIVLSRNSRHPHLPRVLVVRDATKQPTSERVVDLEKLASADPTRQLVKSPLPNGSHGIRLEQYIERGLALR
jgi:HD-GYP domain-containing protein (c-di-GMP phosphodiesterase class II)